MEQIRLILQDATNYGFWNFIGYCLIIGSIGTMVYNLLVIILKLFKRN